MVLSNITGPNGRCVVVYIKESINYAEVIVNIDFRELVWIAVKCHSKEFIWMHLQKRKLNSM